MTQREPLLLFTLACINFTHIIDFMIIMPLGDIFMQTFSINPVQFSFLVSSYKFSAAICGFIGTFLLDRFDRKSALLFVYGGFTIGTFACALAPSFEILLAARAITGGFGGIIAALVLSIVGDQIPYERRAGAMGWVMTAFSLASVLGVPMGLYLAELSTWRTPFYSLAVLGMVVLGLIVFALPVMKGHLKGVSSQSFKPLLVLQNVFGDSNQRNALLLSILLVGGQFLVIPFIAPYLLRNGGFDQSQIKFVYLVGGAFTIFTSPFFGKMADRFGKKQVFTFLAVLAFVPTVLVTQLGEEGIALVLLVTTLFFVLVTGRMAPVQAMITAVVSDRSRGSFMSLKSSLQQLGSGISTLLVGWIIVEDPVSKELGNYEFAGYLSVIVGVLAIILAQRLHSFSENPKTVQT